jgi:hypothetical protein
VAPPIAVEDVAPAAAFPEDSAAIIGLIPASEEPAGTQQRVGSRTIEPGDLFGHGQDDTHADEMR